MTYIVGCNHGIQQEKVGDTQENTEERTEQRAHFTHLIDEIVGKGEIRLICEEWSHEGARTIARAISDKHGLQWLNIDATPKQLDELGIRTLLYTSFPIPRETKATWHAKREKFMLHKIQQERGGAENLLVICGFDHMLPLSGLVREEIGDVEVVDYRKVDWYRPEVFFGDSCDPES